MIIGQTADSTALSVDLARLIGSHACVVANSGGGKSTLIRRLVEVSAGQVQQIILDPEDEFYTLRERHDFVVAGGDGGDIPARLGSAGQLARTALQHGFSLIVQLNDLGEDAPAFVGDFLDSLISAPRDLWRPLLVILDETQRFAPSEGQTAATHGVRALSAQGRKRGFTGIFASQRIAKIDPHVRGDVNNWMLGRVGQALDRRTVADALGFGPSSAEARSLQGLGDCNFWGFGPAIAREPVLFKVDDPETTRVRPGQAKVPTPPAPEALREILAGLARPVTFEQGPASNGKTGVAIEAIESVRLSDYDSADLIDELERRDPEWLKSHDEFRACVEDRDLWMAKAERFDGQIRAAIRALGVRPIDEIADGIEDRRWAEGLKRIPPQGGGGPEVDEGQTEGTLAVVPTPRATAPASAARTATEKAGGGNASSADRVAPALNGIGQSILDNLLLVSPAKLTWAQAALMAGRSPKSGPFFAAKKQLVEQGLVQTEGQFVWSTEQGRGIDRATALAIWRKVVDGFAPRMLDVLADDALRSREMLGAAMGVSTKSGSWFGGLKSLRERGLIEEFGPELRLAHPLPGEAA